MTDYSIRPSSLQGSLLLPPSKSQTMRAFFLASLADGESEVRQPLFSSDTKKFLAALSSFGARVKKEEEIVKIQGVAGTPLLQGGHIHVGNSGLALRFLTAGFALSSTYMMITGDDSIRTLRPMEPLIKALCQMQAFCISTKNNGFAPIIVKGPMRPTQVTIDGRDSQPVSALLLVSSFLEGKTTITVKNPGEKPYVEMTLQWLQRLEVPVQRKEYRWFSIEGRRRKKAFQYEVPADMSSNGFPMAAALITPSKIRIENVAFADVQADTKLIFMFQKMGGKIEMDKERKTLVVEGSKLSSFSCDVEDMIDALPILAVVGCFAKGKSQIFNAYNARNKESDRLSSITQELRKMGAKIEEKRDSLLIEQTSLKGAVVESHQDHRIAMALCVAALGAEGETILRKGECVEKSYPHFFEEMKRMGADIHPL